MTMKLLLASQPRYVHARYAKEKRGALKDKPIMLDVVRHPDTKVLVQGRVMSTKKNECHKNYRLEPETWFHSTGENLVLDDLRIVRIGKNGSKDAGSRQNDSLGSFYIEFSAFYQENGNYILGGSEATCQTDPIYDQCHDETRRPSLKRIIVSEENANGHEVWIHTKRALPKKNKVKAKISIADKIIYDADCKVDDRLAMFNLPRVPPENLCGDSVLASVRLEISYEGHEIESADSIDIHCQPDGSFSHSNSSTLQTAKPKVTRKRKHSQHGNGSNMQQDNVPTSLGSKSFVESNRPAAKNQSQRQPPERSTRESFVNENQVLPKYFYQNDNHSSTEKSSRMELTGRDLPFNTGTGGNESNHGDNPPSLQMQTVDTGNNRYDTSIYVHRNTENHPKIQEIQPTIDQTSHTPYRSDIAHQCEEDTRQRKTWDTQQSHPTESKFGSLCSAAVDSSPSQVLPCSTNADNNKFEHIPSKDLTAMGFDNKEFLSHQDNSQANWNDLRTPEFTVDELPDNSPRDHIPGCQYIDTAKQYEYIALVEEPCHNVIPFTENSTGCTADWPMVDCSATGNTFQPQSQLHLTTVATTELPTSDFRNQELNSNRNFFDVTRPTSDEREIANPGLLLPQNVQLPPPDTVQQSPRLPSTSNYRDPPDVECNDDDLQDIINHTYDWFPSENQWELPDTFR